MKPTRHAEQGSVVTIVLVSVVLMGIGLGSYLSLVSNQNQSINRSQLWNATIPVAEGGVEEAFAHINKHNKDRIKEGWALAPDGTNVVKQRIIGDTKYRVFLNAYKEPPMLLAEGYIKDPRTQSWVGPRKVLVDTIIDPLIDKVLAAKGQIDLHGNNVASDSFDSEDPNYSTGGQYDPAKTKDKGDIATNGSFVDSLAIGNANIKGHVGTGPGGTVTIGANGAVGSKAWNEAGNKGIEPGWVRDDVNIDFPDVQAPYTIGLPPLLMVGGRTIGNGDYLEVGNLVMNGSQKLLVTGKARLYVKGNVSFTASASIEIAPGASLELYVGGPNAELGGKGVMNTSGNALNFTYYGLASNTSLKMSGNGAFAGSLYAPQAHLQLGGGGNNKLDFIGGAVVNTAFINGHFNFHYDEALARLGPRRWYVPNSWNETKGWAKL